MKKILLLAAVLTASFGVQAQGFVFFGNLVNSRISTNSLYGGGATGWTAAAANQYYFALFIPRPPLPCWAPPTRKCRG